MKFIKYILILSIVFAINLNAEDSAQTIIQKAMKDELSRSMDKLSLENLKKPFFISYTIFDSKIMTIKASLGAIINSEEQPARNQLVKVLVGDYNLDNENYVNLDLGGSSGMLPFGISMVMPLENDYYGIRRSLWLSTDEEYKKAAENYEGKLSAMKQQNLSPEDSLPDLCKVKKVVINNINDTKSNFDKPKWENIAKELSALFKDYRAIFTSSVSINFNNSDIYFVNSEGTETAQKKTIAAIQVNASAIASDGEPLKDHVLYYEINPDVLPSLDNMKKDVKAMIDNLVALTKAPAFDESYSGPVLFEEQAAAEIFSQRVLSSNGGLQAERKGIYSNQQFLGFMNQSKDKSLEDKIGKKVISNTLSVKVNAQMSKMNDINLIGSYKVDAEGVVPNEELVLIDKGILKTFLNGRTPSLNVKQSNGHCGYRLLDNALFTGVGPSVIIVTSSETESRDGLKKKLIEKAKENGLKYTYIIKKVKCSNTGASEGFDLSSIMSFAGNMQKKGGLSKPICINRINTETGVEELVRGASIDGLTINSLKKVIGASNNNYIYNTLHTESSGGFGGIFSFAMDIAGEATSGLNGKPASIILPDALLIDEVDIQKETRAVTSRKPIVENPVGK
ncbi:MAG: metallopeptidase TldD-related protein [FCB group bacterium]